MLSAMPPKNYAYEHVKIIYYEVERRDGDDCLQIALMILYIAPIHSQANNTLTARISALRRQSIQPIGSLQFS